MCHTCESMLSWTRRAFNLPDNKLNSELTNTLSIYLFKYCNPEIDNFHKHDEKYLFARHVLSLANKYFIEEPDPDLKKLIKTQLDAWYFLYDTCQSGNRRSTI